MSKNIDISLDEFIAKEGISVNRPQMSGQRVVNKDTKSDGLENIVFKVDNELNDSFKHNTKRKNPFEDKESEETLGAKKVSANDTNTSRRGSQFNSNCGQIFVDNIKYEVTDEDIHQLFGAFGKLKRAAINFERTGRSAGSALVVFEKRVDAMNATQSLTNITLDGRPLQLTLIDSNNFGQQFGKRVDNMNSRLKSQSKESSISGGRQLWSDIAKNSNSNEEQVFVRNNRFKDRNDNKQKEEINAEDLDADLESYLAQRKSSKD